MITGFNTNVRHGGRTFHVQTEDSGRAHPHVISHLYFGGTILASEKRDIYEEVKDDRWSMTKILADLACNTPRGIELDQIRIDQGESISISGRVTGQDSDGTEVKPQEIVQLMQAQRTALIP